MKNLLIFTAFLTLISCTHHDQKIKFDLNLNEQKSNIGKGAKNEIVIGQNDKFDGIKKLSEIIKYNGSKSCIQIA